MKLVSATIFREGSSFIRLEDSLGGRIVIDPNAEYYQLEADMDELQVHVKYANEEHKERVLCVPLKELTAEEFSELVDRFFDYSFTVRLS